MAKKGQNMAKNSMLDPGPVKVSSAKVKFLKKTHFLREKTCFLRKNDLKTT